MSDTAPAIRHYLQFRDLTADEYALPVRARRHHQEEVQGLREAPAAGRPHAGDDLREGVDPHPRELRGRHVPAGRQRGAPDHRRQPAGPRRADRGQRQGHQPHGRPGDDPHLRADQDRALRRAFARAGDQRPDQRVPPLPDPGRHLHLHRAPRLDHGQDGGLGRRRQQHGQHLAAGGRDPGLQGAREHAHRLRGRPVGGRHPLRPTATRSSRTRWKPAAAPTW